MRALSLVALAACASPKNSLIRTLPEAPGANCPSGGVAIQTGIDDNDDGRLEDGEVDETSYICNGDGAQAAGTLEGSVTIASSLDVQLVAPFSRVTGTLTIAAGGLDTLALPNLVEVGSIATSGANNGLTSIELDKLSLVDGDLALAGAASLATVKLPKLSMVGGALALSDLPALAEVDVPSLSSVQILSLFDVTVDLSSWPAIAARTLYVEGASIGTLAPVAADDLQSVTLIATDLADTGGLASTSAPGELQLEDNASLINAELPALVSAATLTIDGNASLVTLVAPKLASVDQFYVFSNPLLPGCQVDDLLASLAPPPSSSSTTGNSSSCP